MKPIHTFPPRYLFFALVLMAVLHIFLPGPRILSFPWNLLGCIPLVLGIVLNLSADRSLKQYETTVKHLERSTALVTTGVFRYTRHPMYLGFVLILLGIAALLGSCLPFGVIFPFAIFLDMVLIRYEEMKLKETFGQTWLEYKKKVRRWV